jgi:hypothetical protein
MLCAVELLCVDVVLGRGLMLVAMLVVLYRSGIHIATAKGEFERWSTEEKNVEYIASISCKDTKEWFPAYPSFGLQ